MNLKHLQYFRVLASLEHYTRAANQLYITQPSLTYAISELEKELETHLFEKQGRNVYLTKYGRFFLTYVDTALNELDKGIKELRELTSPYNGTIDFAFIYTLSPHFVPTMIQTFSTEEGNKNILFSFNQGNTKNIIQGLKDEKFDLAFCSFAEDEPDIDFLPLVQQELVIIVPYGHPLANHDYVDLKDTVNFPFVFFNKQSGIRPLIDSLFTKVGIKPKIVCEVEEDNAVAGLVSINYGIAIIPRIWLLNHFNVKILSIRSPLHQRFIYIASMKNKYLSRSVHRFRDFAIKYSKVHSLTKGNHI
ncbi:LysR family transcriptional regulator [Clostridium estertheticum]|uniref:LysR family transcriptional regulator n=1 Tax=Clostridium estertheticum TaxID=238834 RepID=UPI001C7D8AE2|nr:LysR family transcriptional regulator [Clostridium estertheticum]MBX4266875.1 LysR family transcriptional regulator [Clostridium estertheticum]MBX4271280.1 LysR family transcriptional regulator [Clostridium estertheticum]WLC78760.1 LysR family transcriptional regulator [Clostridium estertheticum]WLC89782.1 LysR family transcriptional regulator [Clostridium estertheticum]